MDLVENVKFWVGCLNPKNFKAAMAKEKGKGDLIEACRNILIAAVIMVIPVGLVMLLLGSMPVAGAEQMTPIFIATYIIISVIIAPIGFLIIQGIYWIIARVLGGTGEYREHAYFASWFTSGMYILNIVAVIPFLGEILSLVLLIISCYLEYVLIRQVHGLGKWKAALAALLLPVVALLVLIALIALSLYLTPVMLPSGPTPVPVPVQ